MEERTCLKDLFIGKTDGAVESKEDNFQELVKNKKIIIQNYIQK